MRNYTQMCFDKSHERQQIEEDEGWGYKETQYKTEIYWGNLRQL